MATSALSGGNDVSDIADGSVKGNSFFSALATTVSRCRVTRHTPTARLGAGSDTMTLAETSKYTGTVDFGGGADTLTIGGTSMFSGTLANAQRLAVSVSGGTFDDRGGYDFIAGGDRQGRIGRVARHRQHWHRTAGYRERQLWHRT
ncbi:hypothetical protein [Sphingopyxis sp.]|uniref:hypothetical protein n=1 Tax=Sphingopyxis sp. TaxID=1908224 RepID=UPI0025EBFA9B|nr:hypothetical protein [Sphingopyxis sp.]MBK6413243.1 hypothetical protein [Sphingopyxis sp.]